MIRLLLPFLVLGCVSGEDSEDDPGADGDVDADTDTGVGGGPGGLCVDLINEYRDTMGLTHYTRWADAESCSDGEAQSDSQTGTPHGAFGACGESAQNECPGWPGPPESLLEGCLAAMWAEGPGEPFSEHGHFLNMSSTGFSEVACGFFQTPGGDYWAVQNFR